MEPSSPPAACPVCDALLAPRDVPGSPFVAELKTGQLLFDLHPLQEGHLRFVAKSHVADLLQLPDDERLALWGDLDLVVRAVRVAFQPQRLNLTCSPDGLATGHLSWDLVPRYADGEDEALPFWQLPGADEALSEESLAEQRRRLLRGFLSVAPVRRETPPVKRGRGR
ncbi:MAG: HIT family protein [Candidatus Sericytochromatia bacterium]|nr:HIT family protein [Candidatus Sericytochromatia bacterium]